MSPGCITVIVILAAVIVAMFLHDCLAHREAPKLHIGDSHTFCDEGGHLWRLPEEHEVPNYRFQQATWTLSYETGREWHWTTDFICHHCGDTRRRKIWPVPPNWKREA